MDSSGRPETMVWIGCGKPSCPAGRRPAACQSLSSAASPCSTHTSGKRRRRCSASAADCSTTTRRCGGTPCASSAAVITPVPPPSSTTRPDGCAPTSAAMRAASRGELAQMAPTLAGWATSSRRKRDCGERATARSIARRTRATPTRAARVASAAPATPVPSRRARRARARTPGVRTTRLFCSRMSRVGLLERGGAYTDPTHLGPRNVTSAGPGRRALAMTSRTG